MSSTSSKFWTSPAFLEQKLTIQDKGAPPNKEENVAIDFDVGLMSIDKVLNVNYPTSKELEKLSGKPLPPRQAREYLVYYPRNTQGGDYSDCTTNPGELRYTNIKSLLARFFISIHANWGRVENWRDLCIGVISFVRNNPEVQVHMPMFDFDGKNIRTHLKKRVKALQEKYGLGDAWVYGTKRGFHVYFFTDSVPQQTYLEMLGESQCCRGFQQATRNKGYGTLRVSAKFTKFDIGLEYILRSKERYLRRMPRKAHVAQELIRLGQVCGTHFASLFPQWAYFHEDETEWRSPAERKKRKSGKEVAGKKIKKLYVEVEEQPYTAKTKTGRPTSRGPSINFITSNDITFTTGTTATWGNITAPNNLDE